MTQNTVFPAPPAVLAAIAGSTMQFPVNRIFCVGRNYHAHAAEMGVTIDKTVNEPFYFCKHPQHLVASGAEINYPPQTSNYHYEMEWVLAIGQGGFEIKASHAKQHIYGYACGLDMTRRDVQQNAREKGHPWDLGKDFEQSAVLSPIVPISECGELHTATIQLKVNGELRQNANINMLIWNSAELIEHLSRHYHLQAGDLIFTGTPEGVGPVTSGDNLEGEIEGLGSISLSIC